MKSSEPGKESPAYCGRLQDPHPALSARYVLDVAQRLHLRAFRACRLGCEVFRSASLREGFLHRLSGFSLIELLVAAVLLVSMLVPIFGSLHSGIQGTERVSEESIAANHAVALLERLANVPYRRLPEIPADTPESELAAHVSLPGGLPPAFAGPDFRRYVTVKQVAVRTEDPTAPDNSEAGSLKRIEVSVKWRPDYLDRKSERTITFRTLVTDDREVF